MRIFATIKIALRALRRNKLRTVLTMLGISTSNSTVTILAGLAILMASINIVGGFLVTRRMLEMFRK